MSGNRPAGERPRTWSACAFAVAAVVSASSLVANNEVHAIQQIERYCTASWRNAGIDPQEWQDCTQQTLTELLQRVSRCRLAKAIGDASSPERRELNRTVWRMVQRWRRSPRWFPYHDGAGTGGKSIVSDLDGREVWEDIMTAARQCLSVRQQRILRLTRDGWRTAEIAQKLHLSPARVSDEKYKAIGRLRAHLREIGVLRDVV